MRITEANKILKGNLYSDRWYFEERGATVWFMEKLKNQYNRVFPVTVPSGEYTNDIYEFHVQRAIGFVKRRRRPGVIETMDVTTKSVSGYSLEDPEGSDDKSRSSQITDEEQDYMINTIKENAKKQKKGHTA